MTAEVKPSRMERKRQRLAAMTPEEREVYESEQYFKPDKKQRQVMADMGLDTWEEVLERAGNNYAKQALRADPHFFDTVITVIEYDKWSAKAQEAYNRHPFNAPTPPFRTVRIVNNSEYVRKLKEEIAEEDRRAKEIQWEEPQPLPEPRAKPKEAQEKPKPATTNLQVLGTRTLQGHKETLKTNVVKGTVRDPKYLQKKLREMRKGMKLSKRV